MSTNLIVLIIVAVMLNIGCVASILRCQYDFDQDHDYAGAGFAILGIATGTGAVVAVLSLIVLLVPAMA